MASNVTEFDEDSDIELEEEDLFPVVSPKAVEAYKKLKNCFFKGRYIGQIKWKAAFAFKRAENKKVSELFSLIDDLIDREENRVRAKYYSVTCHHTRIQHLHPAGTSKNPDKCDAIRKLIGFHNGGL